MQADKFFKNCTIFFYEGKYQEALISINHYLEIKASNSLAYNNRALIHFYLGNHLLAKQDIETSLHLNHLNYLAYYNLFSIYSRQKQYPNALKALQLSVAAMSLIKGRLNKDLTLVRRAMELTENNFDALVLYLLLNVQMQNYADGLRVVEVALKQQQNNGILSKLRAYLFQLQNKYSADTEQAFYDYLLQVTPRQQKLVIKQNNNAQLLQQDINAKIASFLTQFNELYAYLNQRAGGMSYLIAKTQQKKDANQLKSVSHNKSEIIKRKQMIKAN